MKRMRRGMAMRDGVAAVLCAGMLGVLFVPMAVGVEMQSRLQICVSRLKRISDVRAMYGSDHADSLASLQSLSGVRRAWTSLGRRTYSNDSIGEQASAADHAVDIIRRRGNRTDIESISAWIAPPSYNTLVLADYLGEALPSPNWACPEDANLLAWQRDPMNFNNLGVPSPVAPGELSNADKRWPYRSSYMTGPSDWTNDLESTNSGAWHFGGGFYQRRGGHTSGRGDIGYRRMADVAFPSRKIERWDLGSRHFTPRAVYWNFVNTKQPILFYDGVVRTTRTGAMEQGWNWTAPQNRYSSYPYRLDFGGPLWAWHPGAPEGSPQTFGVFYAAFFATTRDGLAGADRPQ